MRIVFGVTAAVTARTFLRGQLAHLAGLGWSVHLVCGEAALDEFAVSEHLDGVHHVPMAREPSLSDPGALLDLWRTLRAIAPQVSVMGTPKMGVLGTVAARLAGVPRRVYLVHGYRAEGLPGPRGAGMRLLDRLACALATDVVAVSGSLRDRLVAERVVPSHKVEVLGHGSANGVDLVRFRPATTSERSDVRRSLGLPTDAPVIAFVGRLTRDKGVQDLARLWAEVTSRQPRCRLLVAGADESSDDDDRLALTRLLSLRGVHHLGEMDRVEDVYRAADVLVMLSRREGLPTVVLEAAACGVPTVAMRATGVVDAVVDGETGVLVGPGHIRAVARHVDDLLDDDDLRKTMGDRARERVVAQFDEQQVWRHWVELLAVPSRSVARP